MPIKKFIPVHPNQGLKNKNLYMRKYIYDLLLWVILILSITVNNLLILIK